MSSDLLITDSDSHQFPEEHAGVVCEQKSVSYTESGTPHTAENGYIRRFKSFVDFIDYVQRNHPSDDPEEVWDYGSPSSMKTDRDDFNAEETWDDCMELAESGWDEGRSDVLEMLDSMELDGADLDGEVMETHRDVYGERLNMGAFMAGDPECYTRREYKEDERTSGHAGVTINVSITYSSGVSKEAIKARGAAVAALCEILKNYGIAVEVNVVTALTSNNGVIAVYEIPVKRQSDVLKPDQLAFQLANPDMLRRIVFGAAERDQPEIRNDLGSSYGYPADVDSHKGKGDDDHVIYMDAPHYSKCDWGREKSRSKWIENKLQEQGIKLKETI